MEAERLRTLLARTFDAGGHRAIRVVGIDDLLRKVVLQVFKDQFRGRALYQFELGGGAAAGLGYIKQISSACSIRKNSNSFFQVGRGRRWDRKSEQKQNDTQAG